MSSRCQHLLVVGGDEPELHVHVASSFLGSDELQHILVSHPVQVEDLVLVLPRLLVLENRKQTEVKGQVQVTHVLCETERCRSKQVKMFHVRKMFKSIGTRMSLKTCFYILG